MFWKGFFFAMFVLMAIQDWMGLTQWLAWETSHWVDYPWWMGAGMATLIALSAIKQSIRRAGQDIMLNIRLNGGL
jgi:hypothetical protein